MQQTFAEVGRNPQQLVEAFYGQLFMLAPDFRPLFPEDMSEQKKKLLQSLVLVVNNLKKPEAVLPAVQELGRRHVDYGVKPEHYQTVGAALIWALSQQLGEQWNDEVQAAWVAAYTLVANVMVEASQA
ncbi:globin family protein [Herpetosiphon sp.]|uniref:Globin n=1 Tax=Herpetosiphon aurantiacus (strain ATCC 23779 / DSM 785 / 114-95) TaxID=316274 RepID=A9AW41_HERA2|nr:globin family protein [Herpetosiphon sp.]ABX03279.1 globin [Herpetosiphon aurantiacus DSM 785]